MSGEKISENIAELPSPISWVDFLQQHPPGSIMPVLGANKRPKGVGEEQWAELIAPELQLHCPEQTCNAYMFFNSRDGGATIRKNSWERTYLTYWCRNCGKYSKIFSISIVLVAVDLCQAYKFGELPHFGPPVPARVLRLIQPDRELFLSGRRCENQGLGIGAFTYYRRVVENQWTRLVEEIIKVAKAINAADNTIASLETSKDEKQFSKAVKNVKDAIPASLLINGQNPLLLLHGALSQGVHNLTDEECLSIATSIRVVLVELAEKLGYALKDEKELNDAVKKLSAISIGKGNLKHQRTSH